MISRANMIKRVDVTSVPLGKAKNLFSRHETDSRYRGFASFGGKRGACALLEVADTPYLREKGLMGRKNLPFGCGMLFTDLEGGAFWMKGCKIPLDIVFLDDSGVVTRVYTMKADGGAKKYYYGDEKTAIELPSGFCAKHGVKVGTKCNWRTW